MKCFIEGGANHGTKKLYLHCDGGFGNRFNVLVAGLYLAKALEYDPIISWPTNNWCGAGLEDLLENVFETWDAVIGEPPCELRLLHEDQLKYGGCTSIHQFQNLTQLKDYVEGKDFFYFNNLIPFHLIPDREDFFNVIRELRFRKEITDLVDEVTGEDSFIGIHIRKTDFGDRVNEDDLFVMAKDRGERVFICSDDPITEKKFLTLPNVFSFDKTSYVEKMVEGSWNSHIVDDNGNAWNFNVNRSKQSVVEAVVDLLCLSRADELIGHPLSTFLATACILKQCQKTTNI